MLSTRASIIIASVACAWILFRDQPVRFTADDTKFKERYGEWAIVAGASEGLGAAWAEELCQLHVNVLLVARREHVMKELALRLESQCTGIQVDYWVQDLAVSNLKEVFSEVLHRDDNRKYGFLVYNAAHNPIGRFLDLSIEGEEKTVDLNVRNVLQMTHVFGNYLKALNGTGGMILMSSLSGEFGTAFVSNYAATKAWNTAFAHGLRHELQPHGIDVMACVAGATATPNFEKTIEDSVRLKIIEQSPEQVVKECIQGIGAVSSIQTGVVNKLSFFFLKRLLPLETSISIVTAEFEKMLPDSQKNA